MGLPEQFAREFQGTNTEYRPQMMWFWDAPLEEEELRRQVRGFHEQGIVTFFVHPMFGFPVDYLGAEMLQALGWAIDEAKKYDMRFWIYDEYNWPSGVAGCYVIKDQLERRQLILVKSEWKAGEEAPQLEGRLVGRYEKEGQMTDFWEVPQGGVCPFAQWSPFCWDQEGYADICDDETTKAFLDYTFDRYQGAFGEDFGKTLGGVFTDEASYCIAGPYGQSYSPIAWSHGFGEEFLRRYGYDITTQLVSLFEQVGEWRKVRLDYWRLLTDLLSVNYYKQYAERCDEMGIQLTGHVSGEEHFRWQLLMYGDPWLTLKWMHQPGIDSIFPRMNHDADYFMTAAKMGSAVLRYSGRERLLCETYTGSGWELTPADMKLICDKLVLGGVNLIQYMGAYYSVAGMRKVLLTGYPPSHSFQQAWWPYYHLFGDYVGRLCHTLVATKPTAKIGLVYPTSTAYVEWQGTAADLWGGAVSPERLERFQLVFHALTNVLLELGFDYEYLFEEVFAQGQVAEGVLKVANAEFDTLIVPAATALPTEVARRLAEFSAAGGQVVFVNYLPEWADGDSEALALVEALTGQPGEAANAEVDARINAGAGTEIKDNGKVTWIVSSDIAFENRQPFAEALRSILPAGSLALPALPEGVRATRRIFEGAPVVMVYNLGDEARAVGLTAGLNAALDPETGDCFAVSGNIDLAARQSLVLTQLGAAPELEACAPSKSLELGQAKFETVQPNLFAASWRFHKEGEDWVALDGHKTPNEQLLEGGEAYECAWEFTLGDFDGPLELVVEELGEPFELILNDQPVTGLERCRIWDWLNLSTDVTGLVKPGLNEVRFSSRAPAWKCIHQPPLLALRGRFAVVDGAIASETGTIEPGSWAEQGYPHYVGTGTYTWTFKAPEEAGRVFLETAEVAVVASVTLNGQRLATRLWAPYRFELTQALQPGQNTLTLEITSTSVNLLGWNDPWKLIHWQFPNGRTEGLPAGLIAPARLLW